MKAAVDVSIEPFITLGDGFWPSMQIYATLEDQFVEDGKLCDQFVNDDVCVVEIRNRPEPSFRVARDIRRILCYYTTC